jgi:hypothetical protein
MRTADVAELTAHNGLFSFRPPLAGSVSVLAGAIASLILTPKLRRILSVLILLRKSLYDRVLTGKVIFGIAYFFHSYFS